jgi:hypothetical protein
MAGYDPLQSDLRHCTKLDMSELKVVADRAYFYISSGLCCVTITIHRSVTTMFDIDGLIRNFVSALNEWVDMAKGEGCRDEQMDGCLYLLQICE